MPSSPHDSSNSTTRQGPLQSTRSLQHQTMPRVWGDRLAVINRCVRTCKKLYQKFVMEHPSIQWKDALHDVVNLYNNTSHSSLQGRLPDQAYQDITLCIRLYEKARKHNKEVRLQAMRKFEKGTRLRLLVRPPSSHPRTRMQPRSWSVSPRTYPRPNRTLQALKSGKPRLLTRSAEIILSV